MPTTQPLIKDVTRPQPSASLLQRDTPITLLGQASAWFAIARDGEAVVITPKSPVPRRCVIRAIALFHDAGESPEACTAIPPLHFSAGAAEGQRFVPFSPDERRRLRELILPIESSPDDQGPATAARWRNHESATRRLCAAAGITWRGLSTEAIDTLVRFIPYCDSEPLEGCALHALVQNSQRRGKCVVQVGLDRGKSTAMMALALAGSDETASLICIEGHLQEAHHADHVRILLRQVGQERRLVQFGGDSAQPGTLLRPGCASLVVINTVHCADHIRIDAMSSRDLLADDGCLVFVASDSNGRDEPEEPHPDIRREIEQFLDNDATFRPCLRARTLIAFARTT